MSAHEEDSVAGARSCVAAGRKKKGASNQDRSENPRQGAVQNSTWPTPPDGGAAQVAASVLQEPEGSGWRFSRKQKLDAHASIQNVSGRAEHRPVAREFSERWTVRGHLMCPTLSRPRQCKTRPVVMPANSHVLIAHRFSAPLQRVGVLEDLKNRGKTRHIRYAKL